MLLWESGNNFDYFFTKFDIFVGMDSNIITHMEILHLLTLESVVQMIRICLGPHYIMISQKL